MPKPRGRLTYESYYDEAKRADGPGSDRLAFDSLGKREASVTEDGKVEKEI
jgi:hypothetical protein